MGASDLAATLRRLADADVTFPFDCQDRLQELMPELATALERGAAAEAAVAASRRSEATYDEWRFGDGLLGTWSAANDDLQVALAAYDALTEEA